MCRRPGGEAHRFCSGNNRKPLKGYLLNLLLITQSYHYEHPDILACDYWSISIVDCVSVCLIPGCFWVLLYPALFSLLPD